MLCSEKSDFLSEKMVELIWGLEKKPAFTRSKNQEICEEKKLFIKFMHEHLLNVLDLNKKINLSDEEVEKFKLCKRQKITEKAKPQLRQSNLNLLQKRTFPRNFRSTNKINFNLTQNSNFNINHRFIQRVLMNSDYYANKYRTSGIHFDYVDHFLFLTDEIKHFYGEFRQFEKHILQEMNIQRKNFGDDLGNTKFNKR
jgi:hypothetical protein